MTVTGVPGAGGKYVIKVPVELLGNPKEMGFTVVTAKPGASGEVRACDVSTMAAGSAEDGLFLFARTSS